VQERIGRLEVGRQVMLEAVADGAGEQGGEHGKQARIACTATPCSPIFVTSR
jgi:hypothetical protein